MPLPLLEPFTGSAGVLANPPWTQMNGTYGVNYDGSGAGVSSGVGEASAFDNLNTYNNDQYAQVKIASGIASGRYAEALVRCSGTASTKTDYAFFTDGVTGAGHTALCIHWNNVFTALRSFSTTFANGDILRIEIVGRIITCYKNGSSLGTYDTTSDTNKIDSGAAGVGVQTTLISIDDWEGGNMVVATPFYDIPHSAQWQSVIAQ